MGNRCNFVKKIERFSVNQFIFTNNLNLKRAAQQATIIFMIKSWKHKGIKKFYLSGDKSGVMADHARKLKVILQLLDAADSPEKLNLPGLGFHKLKGALKDFYSLTVSANWRVIFQFEEQDATLVNYIDYH